MNRKEYLGYKIQKVNHISVQALQVYGFKEVFYPSRHKPDCSSEDRGSGLFFTFIFKSDCARGENSVVALFL